MKPVLELNVVEGVEAVVVAAAVVEEEEAEEEEEVTAAEATGKSHIETGQQ
jgi:hypothetical protein